MKRGQQSVEARPEAARRRKPCSKIEARLRQRRDKVDKTEETSKFSPRTTRQKRDSERSSRSSITSSSESEISPRFMTSKQHVELVNFESRKFLPVPRFRRLAENFVKKIEAISVRETHDESRETNKNQCQTIVKKDDNDKSSRKAIKTLISEGVFESNIQKRNPRNENFDQKPSKIIDPKIVEEEDALKKRRSRSAPCNPLFKIKCAKDKCPRNLFVERKSLVGERKMTEEIRTCRKNCSRGLRISRSGEVAIASVEGPRVGDGIIGRPNLRDSESRRDEFETILMPKNLQARKLQREESESFFLQENIKLIQYENIESPSNPKDWRSLQREDIESSCNATNRQSLQQQNVESSSKLENRQSIRREDIQSSSKVENRRSIQRKDADSSSNLIHRQSVEEIIIESSLLRENMNLLQDDIESSSHLKNTELLQKENTRSCSNPVNVRSLQQKDVDSAFLQENRKLLQDDKMESSSHSKNTELLGNEDIETYSNPKMMSLVQQKDVESYVVKENIKLLQDQDAESFLQSKNTESLPKKDIESCSNPKIMPSVQQKDVESYALKEDIKLVQDENIASSSDSKNTPLLQKATESSSNLKNRQSLKQENVESSADSKNTQSLHQEEIEPSSHPRNRQLIQRADTRSISLPEDESKNSENHEKLENQEEIKYKDEKNESHVLLHPNNLNSKQEVPKVKTVNKAQEDTNFDSQEGGKDISRFAQSPERRNEPEKRCSPRKPPKKRAFKWETMLEKQHQTSSRSPENRNESSEVSTKIQEENKFDFWAEKDANCSKYCRCPRSPGKSFEERKLVAYSAIREELPKILMKRRYLDSTMNPEKKIEAIKTKSWQQNLRDSANQRSSPERPRKSANRNDSRLNQRLVENFAKRWNRRDCSILADSPQIGDTQFGQRNSKNIEDSAERDFEKNLRKQRNQPKKSKATDSTLSPRNFEESIGAKKVFSVLKRRKSPSPRRVTFRLPGRVIEENSIEDEEDNSPNGRNFENLITEKCTSDSDEAENEEIGWSEKSYQSEKNTEKNYNIEKERSSFVGDKLRKNDEISNSCVEERSRKLSSSNTLIATRMKNLQNMRWPSPSCLAGVDQRDENETDDSEQDWETPTGEDVYRTQEVTYPKETREAMKILMRAKGNVSRCKHSDRCQKKIDKRDIFRQKEAYLRTEKSPERNATPVSSYANALAKFQEGCYLDSNRSLYGTLSQRRVSRNPNVAGGK